MDLLTDNPLNNDSNTISFSPEDDLFRVAENIKRLTVTDDGSQPLMVGVRGLKLSMTPTDVAREGGLFQITDVWWHLCNEDCSVPLATGLFLIEADGTRWQVLTAPALIADQSRWKCACRQTS